MNAEARAGASAGAGARESGGVQEQESHEHEHVQEYSLTRREGSRNCHGPDRMTVPKVRQRLLFYYEEVEEGMPKARARARA